MAITRRRAAKSLGRTEVKGVIITDGLVLRGGRLRVGRRIVDLPSSLKPLNTGPVEVAISPADKTSIVGIAIRNKWITCYVPAPGLLKRLDAAIRNELLAVMVKQKVISGEFANLVKGVR